VDAEWNEEAGIRRREMEPVLAPAMAMACLRAATV
jgi:hypothetical protein